MKKTIFLLAMCLIGMGSLYAACVAGTPILFYDVYAVMPLDDPDEGAGGGGSPDPNQEVTGSIDMDELHIAIGGGVGSVVIVNPIDDEIVAEEVFTRQTSITIPESGAYTAYVTVGGTTYAGDFVVE